MLTTTSVFQSIYLKRIFYYLAILYIYKLLNTTTLRFMKLQTLNVIINISSFFARHTCRCFSHFREYVQVQLTLVNTMILVSMEEFVYQQIMDLRATAKALIIPEFSAKKVRLKRLISHKCFR